ncbi:hypothetical protein HK100_006019 [Physocladia obscura]|uniref:Uncharacterized protein n=1 Tax=Physocladia obscura TaxID=109957 RepID=A0AAD5STI3_9FUNG|nr:hypothetical protein HK100_006019 [Physocladia obscura]
MSNSSVTPAIDSNFRPPGSFPASAIAIFAPPPLASPQSLIFITDCRFNGNYAWNSQRHNPAAVDYIVDVKQYQENLFWKGDKIQSLSSQRKRHAVLEFDSLVAMYVDEQLCVGEKVFDDDDAESLAIHCLCCDACFDSDRPIGLGITV